MKVLHLISSRGFYGAERVAIELCSGLKEHGCESIIGALENAHNPHVEILEEARKASIDTVVFPCASRLDIKLVPRVRNFIAQNSIDVVHCHGYKSNFYGFFASRNTVPIVTTNHNWLTSHWRLRVYRRLDSRWMRFFDRIVAVSDGVKNEMLKYGIPERKITIIDNGIDMSRFSAKLTPRSTLKEEFGFKDDEIIIGAIGNLGSEKGHVYLLKAVQKLIRSSRTIKLLIVGEGPLRASLEQEARDITISNNVIFAGYRSDIPELLSIMDIFVLPSVNEGLPMVLLEAMAAKRPVIATNVGAIPKVIDNTNGILVEPGHVDGLQTAISYFLDNPEMRRQFASHGFERVKTAFSSTHMCAKYFHLYQEVIA